MREAVLYEEELTSLRTEVLFAVLTLVPLALGVWRAIAGDFDWLAILLLVVAALFLVYVLTYRRLRIRLTREALTLRFGFIRWIIPTRTIEGCAPDTVSLWRIGGAGVHFTSIGRRYRAMFNFLEYPRVVVALRVKKGPVRDVVFSTRHPERVMRLIEEAVRTATSAEIGAGQPAD